jgi:ADP-ribose pyrophosphatase
MTNEEMREIQITREEIYDGIVLHVTKDTVRLPGGGTSVREVAWHRGAVCVVPLTEAGEIIFVEQFRYAMDRVLLEIPAGKLEAGETDRPAAARRELSEETGYTADTLIDLGKYFGCPALISEDINMYLATGLHPGECHPDEDEFLALEIRGDLLRELLRALPDLFFRVEDLTDCLLGHLLLLPLFLSPRGIP